MEAMELLRKEMERVGLNNNNNNKKKEMAKEGGIEEMMSGNNDNKNDSSKNEQQKTMLRTPADIFDHPTFYSFLLDMPGLDAQNIKVKVEKGILHITGKKKKQQMGEGVRVVRVERRRARYMRKFTLPADASHQQITATYREGVLHITVAKNPQIQLQIPATTTQVEQSSPSSTSPTTTTTNDNDVSIS